MHTSAFKKYTIEGENNPYWIVAEPMLLRIWADGILRTPSFNLHITNMLCLITDIVFFLGGTIIKIAVVIVGLSLAYLLFPRTLFISFETLLGVNFDPSSVNNFWLYRLLGYVIMIKLTLFLLSGLTVFLRDFIFYLLFMLTNMFPLRIIAKNLQKEKYFAQAIAKTSFMGMYIVQTMTATPFEDKNKWDKVFNLYTHSNQASAREQLEQLSEEYSKVTSPESRSLGHLAG